METARKTGMKRGTKSAEPSRDWRRAAILAAGTLGLAGSVFVGRNAYNRESEELYPLAYASGTLFGLSGSIDIHPSSCDDAAYVPAGINKARSYLREESPVIGRLERDPEFIDVADRLDDLSADVSRMVPLNCDALSSELRYAGQELARISFDHRSDLEAAGAEIRAKFAPIIYGSVAGSVLSIAAIAFGLRRKKGRVAAGPDEDPQKGAGEAAPASDPGYIWSTFKAEPEQKAANPADSGEQGWVRKISGPDKK